MFVRRLVLCCSWQDARVLHRAGSRNQAATTLSIECLRQGRVTAAPCFRTRRSRRKVLAGKTKAC